MKIFILDNEKYLNKITNLGNSSNLKIFYINPTNNIAQSLYNYIIPNHYKLFQKNETEFIDNYIDNIFNSKQDVFFKKYYSEFLHYVLYKDSSDLYLKIKNILKDDCNCELFAYTNDLKVIEILNSFKETNNIKIYSNQIITFLKKIFIYFLIFLSPVILIILMIYIVLNHLLLKIFCRESTSLDNKIILSSTKGIYLNRSEFFKNKINFIILPSIYQPFTNIIKNLKLNKINKYKIIKINSSFRFISNTLYLSSRILLNILFKNKINKNKINPNYYFSKYGLIHLIVVIPISFNISKSWFENNNQKLKNIDKVFFPLSGSISTSSLNYFFKKNNIETIHFQHGLIIDKLGYRFDTTKHLSWGAFDSEILKKINSNSKILNNYIPFQIKYKHLKQDKYTISIFSTTFIYNSSPIKGMKIDRIDNLFRSIFFKTLINALNQLSKQQSFQVLLKIHPNESKKIINSKMSSADFEYKINSDNLEHTIEKSNLIISAYSSVCIQCFLSGKPVLIYDAPISNSDTFINNIDDKIKFSNSNELFDMISEISNYKKMEKTYLEYSNNEKNKYFSNQRINQLKDFILNT